MSPTVFAYIVLLTLLLAGGAAAVERGTRGRGAARHFWTVAIVLGVVAPSGALGWHALTDQAPTVAGAVSGPAELATIVVNSSRYTVVRGSRFFGGERLVRMLLPSWHALNRSLARLNGSFATVAIVAWLTLSLALIAWLAFGVFHWRRAQRAWRQTTLDGISIDVSAVTGPAVVGFLSHRIVLPAWATTMKPEHRRLILEHESEHISARDPERLMLAIVALVLMPWNVGLWWCAARLRRAIELDCDTRVLRRFPRAKEYGYVLLEVASRGRNSGPLAVPLVALLRLPSELELRLRAMTRVHAVGMRGLIAGALGAFVTIAAAFTTPVPRLVSHATSPTATLPIASAKSAGVPLPMALHDTVPKHRADSLANVKHELDSLWDADRTMQAELRAMPRGPGSPDSARAAVVAIRERVLMREQALLAAERPQVPQSHMTYFKFQLAKRARALPGSVAPIYPDSLRHAGVSGEVRAQFVVDTTGRVDPRTIKITSATNPAFAASVRTALPKIRFTPAEIAGHRVKQLVQQPFTFSMTH